MRIIPLWALAFSIVQLTPSSGAAQTPPNTLSGRLFDKNTGAPISAGLVELLKTKRRTLSDSLGRFAFVGIPPGTYTLAASALGYLGAVALVEPGTPVNVLIAPEPVPLPAIVALAKARNARIRGATLRAFGRAELVAAGDMPVAQFVNWKAHLITRPCHTLAYFNESVVQGDMIIGKPPELPAELIAEECIIGPRGGFAPVIVMIDDEVMRYSSEAWAHQTWDLGRVEVLHQHISMTQYPFNRPFALIRMYSLSYLARMAAQTNRFCEHIGGPDTLAVQRLEDLCVGYNTRRPRKAR